MRRTELSYLMLSDCFEVFQIFSFTIPKMFKYLQMAKKRLKYFIVTLMNFLMEKLGIPVDGEGFVYVHCRRNYFVNFVFSKL